MEEGAEHSLESYAVFQQYLAMVEGKMEGFMTSEGISPEAFQAGAYIRPLLSST